MGFKSFAEVDRLTIPEYQLLMEAARLRQIDQDYRNHLQAFLNFAVTARKKTTGRQVPSRLSGLSKFFKKGGE